MPFSNQIIGIPKKKTRKVKHFQSRLKIFIRNDQKITES